MRTSSRPRVNARRLTNASVCRLSYGSLLLLFGRVADVVGSKRMFLFGTGFFAIWYVSEHSNRYPAMSVLRHGDVHSAPGRRLAFRRWSSLCILHLHFSHRGLTQTLFCSGAQEHRHRNRPQQGFAHRLCGTHWRRRCRKYSHRQVFLCLLSRRSGPCRIGRRGGGSPLSCAGRATLPPTSRRTGMHPNPGRRYPVQSSPVASAILHARGQVSAPAPFSRSSFRMNWAER